jgi:hypothetical protein
MKRIAALWIVVYLALAFGYYSVFAPRLDSTFGSAVLSLVVATFTVAFLGSIVALPMAARDASAIWRGLGGAPFEDGKQAAAVGPLRPLGRPLRSPFEGTPCVAYTYAIERARGGDDGGRIADYSGLGLTPAVVLAPQGPIRLLGYPNLDSFPARAPSDSASFQRAEAHLASAPFEAIGGVTSIATDFGKLMAVFTGHESDVRKDYRLPSASGPPDPDDRDESAPQSGVAVSWLLSSGYSLSETCVPVEAPVCAIGIYSADRNGIGSSPGGGTVLQLVPGDGATAPRRLLIGAATRLAIATAFCGAIHGGLWLWLSSSSGHAALPARLRPSITDPVQAGDVATVKKALARGADPNLNESGAPPLFYAAERGNVEMVKALLEGGARTEERDMYGSTPLMGAATYGHTEVVKALIAAGADVNAKNTQFGTTALDDTIEDSHVEAADALRAAGAIDETVTAKNGRPLPAGGGEPLSVCRRFLKAVFAKDPATMQALWERPGVGFEKLDWDIYQSVRTAEPRLVSGFATDDAATLFLRGPSTGGRENLLRYQLVRAQEGGASLWKIRREWILPSTAGVP